MEISRIDFHRTSENARWQSKNEFKSSVARRDQCRDSMTMEPNALFDKIHLVRWNLSFFPTGSDQEGYSSVRMSNQPASLVIDDSLLSPG